MSGERRRASHEWTEQHNLQQLPASGANLRVVATAKQVCVVEDVVQRVQVPPLVKQRGLGRHLKVALPERPGEAWRRSMGRVERSSLPGCLCIYMYTSHVAVASNHSTPTIRLGLVAARWAGPCGDCATSHPADLLAL